MGKSKTKLSEALEKAHSVNPHIKAAAAEIEDKIKEKMANGNPPIVATFTHFHEWLCIVIDHAVEMTIAERAVN